MDNGNLCEQCAYQAYDEDYDDYDGDDPDEDEDESFTEMIAGLSSIVQSIFGDNVSLHIVVE